MMEKNSKNKIIGIPGWSAEGMFGVRTPYIDYIARFGTPLILTPQHGIEDIDLLFLPGGADVSPSRYGAPSYHSGNPNQFLEWFDMQRLPGYIERNVPIVGICRGMQSLVVHFGGTLTQHLYGNHVTSDYPTEAVHKLEFNEAYKAWGTLVKEVNSRHHQCANPNTLPECFNIAAFAKEKTYVREDIPEIIVHKTERIFAVQYHPEDCLQDRLTQAIITQYLNN